jgi:P2-related tail formation protein
MFNELVRVIDDVKPASRHLIGLNISLEIRGFQYCGVAAYFGEELTVYPYTPETVSVGGPAYAGAAVHLVETLTVYP